MKDLHIENFDSSGALRLTAENFKTELLVNALEGKASPALPYMLNDIIKLHLEKTYLQNTPVTTEQVKEYLLDNLFQRSFEDRAGKCDIMVWTPCPGDRMWGHPIFILTRNRPNGPLEWLSDF